ncbi:hypothetical protein LCGC14_2755620 [marine sediment metagenome]|uniref:Uncharacterized protein n=1 Tax=marine sediment metagenome TaxID=412755 RepID=A0A0F8Z0C6_9ZZZZ
MIGLVILTATYLWTIIGGIIYAARLIFGNANLMRDSGWIILAYGPSVWIARQRMGYISLRPICMDCTISNETIMGYINTNNNNKPTLYYS